MSDTVVRDKFGQLDEFTELDYEVLEVLEEISSPEVNPDKTLSAYMADIYDLILLHGST